MQLLKELPRTIGKLFAGNNDEMVFFAIVFFLMIFSSNREERNIGEERSVGFDGNISNNTLVFIIIAFLFMFMTNERSDDLTLINEPAQ